MKPASASGGGDTRQVHTGGITDHRLKDGDSIARAGLVVLVAETGGLATGVAASRRVASVNRRTRTGLRQQDGGLSLAGGTDPATKPHDEFPPIYPRFDLQLPGGNET